MRSEEAQIGKRVRVRMDHHTVNLRGQEGVIVRKWGTPSYAALDVLLDEGDRRLFWCYELDEVDRDHSGARRQRESGAGP